MARAALDPERQRAAETEVWSSIWSTVAVSGSLVIGWTLFVLISDPLPPRSTETAWMSDISSAPPRAEPWRGGWHP
jgi:hypothetical protein